MERVSSERRLMFGALAMLAFGAACIAAVVAHNRITEPRRVRRAWAIAVLSEPFTHTPKESQSELRNR